jgi:hypothetical protein
MNQLSEKNCSFKSNMNSTERYVAYEIISGKIKILLTSVKAG